MRGGVLVAPGIQIRIDIDRSIQLIDLPIIHRPTDSLQHQRDDAITRVVDARFRDRDVRRVRIQIVLAKSRGVSQVALSTKRSP